MNWLITRLHERSTWLAIFALAGLFGIKLEPELREYIINAIIAVAAVVAFMYKEKPSEVVKPPIELQGRSDGGLPVPGAADSGEPPIARSPVNRNGQSQRVHVAMQSPIEPASRRDTKPNFFTSGFNDR
jgi:hypothetical protein